MKLLTFSSLYPSTSRPGHGVFVENRLRHLLASGGVEARVVAPVPWFPSSNARFGDYARMAATPPADTRHDIPVVYPRYPVVPKVGMSLVPWMMYRATLGVVAHLHKRHKFDLIDAHYFYPDGVAAAMLGRKLGIPVVITARGTDLNLIPQYPRPRRQILWAAEQAAAMITVCQALKDVLLELGVADERVTVLRNGVDLQMFSLPDDRARLRDRLGVQGDCLLSVGYLIPRKGHDLVIRSLASLPDARLVIAGDGPERENLEALARDIGVADRVRFLGAVPHTKLRDWYGAADALVLASDREGWANVLLEAMACGTPVVATRIWGTPEVVTCPEAGRLCERTPESIATEARALFAARPDRAATRRYAEGFSWDATSAGQKALFQRILDSRPDT